MTGDNKAVYEFLKTSNLLQDKKGFSFDLIFWMLKDKASYEEIISILRERRIFVHIVWQYGFFHHDEVAIREFISKSEYLCNVVGSNFKSNLYNNYITAHKPRHLEYFPLVNARAHSVGNDTHSNIINKEFRRQYDAFLVSSIEKEEMQTSDRLCYTYFLLLQDRINEAINNFTLIDPESLKLDGSLCLQYDYMSAYLDFYTGDETNYKVAREVVEKYRDYPVLHWRFLFDEITDQLKEFDGYMNYDHQINQNDETAKDKNLKKSKELEPYLHVEMKNKRIKVDHENIESIEIKYYIIDPEILFSRAPFITQDSNDFAFVKPSQVATATLNSTLKSEFIDLEKDLLNENMIIEVSGNGKQEFLRYFSTSLKVVINETYGELKVTDNKDVSLSHVYVKVFSRTKTGQVNFFRDGYTDLNGKYEYSQINSKNLSDIEKFAIFVTHDEHGSSTKECSPPQIVEQNDMDSWNASSLKMNKRMQQKLK